MLVGSRVFGEDGALFFEKVRVAALFVVLVDHVVNELFLVQIVALVCYVVKSNSVEKMAEKTYLKLDNLCSSFVCQ